MIRLITFSIFIFTILFSYSIIAQQMMTFNRKNLTNPAEKIMKPMGAPLPAGTYSIGSSGNFPTIDSAFKKLSTDGIAGAVTLELIDTLYTAPSTLYYGFYLKGPISGATKNSRVTIRPAANKKVTIRGSGESVLRFGNVSYLTLDGISLNGNTTLKVHALKNTQFYHNDAVIFLSNSDHNIIQNITASSDDYTRSYASIGFFLYEFTDFAADSNLIQNNFVPQGGWGSIYISAILPDGSMRKKAIGNIISGNLIGSETDSLNTTGIQLEGCENSIVENNSIQNLRLILKEKVTLGIVGYWCFSCIIRNNIIFNFDDNDSQMGTCAIILSGAGNALGNNNIVCNNMVYDIRNSSKKSLSVASGIYLRYQNNPKIYYNSIYFYGKGSSPSGSAAFYIGVQCTNVEAKNNIFVNTRDESSYCASSIYSSTADFISDNNDLYYEPNQYNCLVKIGNTKYNTLTDWQLIGNDLNSISEMPNFKIPHLHIDESIPTKLESNGIPIPGMVLDFDGEARDSTSTDIGADEFDGTPLVDINEEFRQPLRFALNQNYPNPFNPKTSIQYSIASRQFVTLKIFNVLGQEIETLVNEEKPTGNYEVEFQAANLPSGVYFYRIQAGSFNQVKKMLLIK